MAVTASGTIKISDIATEFQDSTPYSLSEYYRGGAKVPNSSQNTNVPTSGAIRLGNFYSAVRRVAVSKTYSINTIQSNLIVSTLPGYVAGVSDITITVDSGVSLYSTSSSNAALTITGSQTGDIITLINYGTIYGAGGAGGRNNQGGYNEEAGNVDGPGYGGDVPSNAYGNSGGYPAVAGSAGSDGGVAITVGTFQRLNIYNYNTIVGGGGGGGGGGSNNASGGAGGTGGVALFRPTVISLPSVILYNQSGGIFAGGGGGGAGWGNRVEGSSAGGQPGQGGYIITNGGGNFGAQGAAGLIKTSNDPSTPTIINTAGTFILYNGPGYN